MGPDIVLNGYALELSPSPRRFGTLTVKAKLVVDTTPRRSIPNIALGPGGEKRVGAMIISVLLFRCFI
jgi:hypothetical protein